MEDDHLKFKQTKRGLLRAEFKDRYGACCSVQESSIPGEDCLWLGVETNFEGEEIHLGRMHLTRDLVRQLIPVLRHFARKGFLGEGPQEDPYYVGATLRGVGESNLGIEGRVIEVQPSKSVTIQDSRKPGPEGHIICDWDFLDLSWEPVEVPESIPSIYDLLNEH